MSATLSSLYEGWLCFSVAHSFPKHHFFHEAPRKVNYCSTVMPIPIKHLCECKNYGSACAYFPILRNSVKMETFSPQNDHTTKLNINFFIDRYCM